MTDITPEKADRLKQDATDGPWEIHPDYGTVEPDVISGEGCRFVASDADLDLIAAAPDLAKTIAGMRWEYAVELLYDGEWGDIGEPWSTEEEARERYALLSHANSIGVYRLVRRLVGPVEVIDGE